MQAHSAVVALLAVLGSGIVVLEAVAEHHHLQRLPQIEAAVHPASPRNSRVNAPSPPVAFVLSDLETATSHDAESGLSVRVGGYAKLDVIRDFDAIGDTDQFDVATIPTDGRPGENTRLHARETRLNLDTRMSNGFDVLRVFVEGDFFNANDTSFRLRHAFAEIEGVTAGQTWTTFMDEGPGPRLVDFENPSGYIIDRRALLRYEHELFEELLVAVAVEESRIAISEPPGTMGLVNSLWPDLVTRVRWERPSYHVQLAAIVREFQFHDNLSGHRQDITGWGFNFSGASHVTGSDTLYFEVTFGEGIGGFRDATDAGPDAFGSLEALPGFAWNIAWTHEWSKRWSSNFIFSKADVTNSAGQPGSDLHSLQYLAANLIWSPHDRIDVGMEYLFGRREDKDESAGEANRLHFAVWFYLP